MPSGSVKKYDVGASTTFLLMNNIYNTLGATSDPFWNVQFLGTTTVTSINHGCLVFTNKLDPTVVITVGMWTSAYASHLRFGLVYNATPAVDVWAANNNIELALNAGSNVIDYNYSKIQVFTSANYIYITGEPVTGVGGNFPYPYQLRLYMGRCLALETEDPLVANKFYGVFGHLAMPHVQYTTVNSPNISPNFSSGIVRSSRRNEPYATYQFMGNSQITSPGVGNQMLLSPFYVYNANEGVRGELWGLRTAVLKPSSLPTYPDGSIMAVGSDQYLVNYVPNWANGIMGSALYYSYVGTSYYNSPAFFDSLGVVYGQRVLLFKL
jgi:hypothetical protein